MEVCSDDTTLFYFLLFFVFIVWVSSLSLILHARMHINAGQVKTGQKRVMIATVSIQDWSSRMVLVLLRVAEDCLWLSCSAVTWSSSTSLSLHIYTVSSVPSAVNGPMLFLASAAPPALLSVTTELAKTRK